jgi:hypothetical protein
MPCEVAKLNDLLLQLTDLEQLLLSTYRYLPVDTPYFDALMGKEMDRSCESRITLLKPMMVWVKVIL